MSGVIATAKTLKTLWSDRFAFGGERRRAAACRQTSRVIYLVKNSTV
ncbi:hypothetical protein JYQ62_30080 [Nostoc sp. UHCC 0702]|nr:hypothetical protein JYQ62_30080 [Nostoc sp. UHCC 0702]